MEGLVLAVALAAFPDPVFEAQVRNLGHDDFDTRLKAQEYVEAEVGRDPSPARIRRLLAAEAAGDPEVVYRVKRALDRWAEPLVKQVTWDKLSDYPWIVCVPGANGDKLAKQCYKDCSHESNYWPDHWRSKAAAKLYAQRLIRYRQMDPRDVQVLLHVGHAVEAPYRVYLGISREVRGFVSWWARTARVIVEP